MILPSYRYTGPFVPQTNPNRWSCLPTSFAICLNIPVEQIINEIGHNGSEIIAPDLPEPMKRRGFHPQELYKVCYNHRKAVTEYLIYPKLFDKDFTFIIDDQSNHINELLKSNIGVLCGTFNDKFHAVAWDGNLILDPNDIVYTLDFFTISVFYLITEITRDDAISKENSESYKKEIFA